jgi:predicted component of type VI protein secretion system
MQISLMMVTADGKSKEAQVKGLPATIGREEGCKLRVPVANVSRKHCELYESDDELLVRDLGSSNGTYVNGAKIKQTELAPGDVLTVGPVVFVVRIDGFPREVDAAEAFAVGAVAGATTSGAGSGPETRPIIVPQSGSGASVGAKARPKTEDDSFAELLAELRLDDDDDKPKKPAAKK